MSSMKDRFKKRAKEGAQKGFSVNLPEDVKRFTPKKGTYKLDVIPYTVSAKRHPDGVAAGEQWCRRPFLIHYGIGVDNKPQICPRTIGKPCPICEYYEREKKRPGADEEAIKEIRAKARELYNVIDLDNEDDGVQVFEMSYHLFGKLLEGEINEADDDEIAGFAELKGGKTLKVRFSEATMGKNKFLEATRIDFLDRDDYKKSILDDVVDLDSVFNVLPYEELEAVFLEDEGVGMVTGDGDDEEDEAPKSKKKSHKADEDDEDDDAPKAKKKSKPKPADDDDDDDEAPKPKKKSKPKDDDDDDEEEKPKSRRTSKKAPAEDDDEEEAPKPKSRRTVKKTDDDDEEDEAPKPKSKKKAPVDDDDDDEEEKPAPKSKKKPAPADDDDEEETPKAKKKSKGGDGECPLSNGTFGKDFNKFDECDDCEVWSECGKAKRAK
jgi:hypothetical protein